MNGYAIARLLPGEAEEIFAKDQVRHVALMDDGTTFIAFDGDIPVERGTILENVEVSSGPNDRPQIRRTYIDDRPEFLALYTADEAKDLRLLTDDQVSYVDPDMVLVLSFSPLEVTSNPIWSAQSEKIYDKRAALAVV